MNAAIRASLYDLCEHGGLELTALGTRRLKRCLILDLETSALTPEVGDIARFRAESVSDPDNEFDEWVKPPRSLSAEAERVLGVTNDQLARGTITDVALDGFAAFVSS